MLANKQTPSEEHLFQNVFETLQVKIERSKTASRTHKTETFPISRVIMVRIYRDEAMFDGISTKEDIVDTFPVEDKDIIDEEVYEATVMEIDDL